MSRFALPGLLVVLLLAPLGARGAGIYVNTTADVVETHDGRCSLREAVSAANLNLASGPDPGECAAGEAAPVMDVIVLQGATYSLTRDPANEDSNVGGDLDVTEHLAIRGVGSKTVIRNGLGSPKVLGDGDGVLHLAPGGENVDALLDALTIRDGDVGCDGVACDAGAGAIRDGGDGSLSLLGVTLAANRISCTGVDCGCALGGNDCDRGDAAALRKSQGDFLALYDVVVSDNAAFCVSDGCGAGSIVKVRLDDGDTWMEKVAFLGNEAGCEGTDCVAGEILHLDALDELLVQDVEFRGNTGSCEGEGCDTSETYDVDGDNFTRSQHTGLVFEKNVQTCRGDSCDVDEIVDGLGGGLAQGDDRWNDVLVTGNRLSCDGELCAAEEIMTIEPRLLADVELRSNTVECKGADCKTDSLLEVDFDAAREVHIENLVIVSNRIECEGPACGDDGGADLLQIRGGAAQQDGEVHLRAVLLDKNELRCKGESCTVDSVLRIQRNDPGAAGRVSWHGGRATKNRLSCEGLNCNTDWVVRIDTRDAGEDVELTDLVLSGNRLECRGDICDTDDVLRTDLTSDAGESWSRIIVEKNRLECRGFQCDTDRAARATGTNGGYFNLDVSRNKMSCRGDECDADSALDLEGDSPLLAGALVSKNQIACQGVDCNTEEAVELDQGDPVVVNTSIVGNKVSCKKATCEGDGGALEASFGTTRLDQCSIAKNKTDGSGAAIRVFGGAFLSVTSSEIKGNKAKNGIGGIENEGTIVSLEATVLAGNKPKGTDCVDVSGGTGCP